MFRSKATKAAPVGGHLEVSLPACRRRHASERGTWIIDGDGDDCDVLQDIDDLDD